MTFHVPGLSDREPAATESLTARFPPLLATGIKALVAASVLYVLFRLVGFTWLLFSTQSWLIDDVGLPPAIANTLGWAVALLKLLLYGAVIWFIVAGFQLRRAAMAVLTIVTMQLAGALVGARLTVPQRVSITDLDSLALFDGKGQPRVWLVQGRDCHELFDRRGYHPQTGQKLEPVTPEQAMGLLACLRGQPAPAPEPQPKAAAPASAESSMVSNVSAQTQTPQFVAEFMHLGERPGNTLAVAIRFTNKTVQDYFLSTPETSSCGELELVSAGALLECRSSGFLSNATEAGLPLPAKQSVDAVFLFQGNSHADVSLADTNYRITIPVQLVSAPAGTTPAGVAAATLGLPPEAIHEVSFTVAAGRSL